LRAAGGARLAARPGGPGSAGLRVPGLDGRVRPVAPLLPRSVIVPELGEIVTDEGQREEVVRRAHAHLAIGDHVVVGTDAAIGVQLPDLRGRSENLRLRVE